MAKANWWWKPFQLLNKSEFSWKTLNCLGDSKHLNGMSNPFVSAQSHSTMWNERPRIQMNVRWRDDCYNHKGAVFCWAKLAVSFVSNLTYISEPKGRMGWDLKTIRTTLPSIQKLLLLFIQEAREIHLRRRCAKPPIHHTYQHSGTMERHAVLLSAICSFIPNTFLIVTHARGRTHLHTRTHVTHTHSTHTHTYTHTHSLIGPQGSQALPYGDCLVLVIDRGHKKHSYVVVYIIGLIWYRLWIVHSVLS